MSRKARKQSPTGIHHILVQGPHHEQIFADGKQKSRYLETIQKYHEQGKVKLYAYCILDNSANLLIEEAEDSVAQFMRRVGISYVHWFNRTHPVSYTHLHGNEAGIFTNGLLDLFGQNKSVFVNIKERYFKTIIL